MSTPRALNRDLAKQNPEGTFETPFEIVDEKLFTKGEKIATLNRWRQSLLEELSAAGEGMRAYSGSRTIAPACSSRSRRRKAS